MTKPLNIYLAGAFFNIVDRGTISQLANTLRKQGHVVYVPMEHPIENAWDISNKEWGKRVFIEDVDAIRKCDAVVAVVTHGMNDDTGTIWEIGFAYGINKPIYVIHNYQIKEGIASLMVWNSATRNFKLETMNDNKWFLLDKDTVEIEQK